MNIFESLENLNVSEECFDEIMDIIESIINELHAPTSDSAKAVFDRKAEQLQRNTAKHAYHANAARELIDNKSKFHTENPNASTQDRYDLINHHQNQAAKETAKSVGLNIGGGRLSHWAKRNKEAGKLKQDAVDSARNMVQKGKENQIEHFENQT